MIHEYDCLIEPTRSKLTGVISKNQTGALNIADRSF